MYMASSIHALEMLFKRDKLRPRLIDQAVPDVLPYKYCIVQGI